MDSDRTLTDPGSETWMPVANGYTSWEKSVCVGRGTDHWQWACEQLLRWGVKTRSGFRVTPTIAVLVGQEPIIRAGAFGFEVFEPVRVVEVIRREHRVGFAYRTLPGHPVRGEECFILERRAEGNFLTIRSLTQAADERPWRTLYPLLLLAQAGARWRYFRALKRK